MVKPSFLDVPSWDDFEEKLTSLNNKEKGDYFERLTQYYFNLDPRLSSYYDSIWLLSELPEKERAYLGIPSQDLGIDIIAKTGEEYHAIQCKYHTDKNSSVTFNEVSTFISMLEGNPKLSRGYICSTATSTSKNLNKVQTKPLAHILHDTWDNLDENFFEKVKALELGKKVSPDRPLTPRPHQEKALKDAVNYFEAENQDRGKLIFPCGAGKSLTGFWITQRLRSKATLIAVPSLSLVKQTLEVYLKEIAANKKRVKWLCICSDEGIGKSDDVVYYTQDLGVPCETDSTYIEQWLQDNREDEIVVFTTYQSGRLVADISKKLDFTFDVGIYDEAHKTVGSNKKLFSYLLFEENISVRKRVFMTATERFYAGSKDDIISMDDEDIYGDTFTQMSFKEAIESELLTDYKVITIDVKKSEISEFIRSNNLIQLNDKWKKETEARSLASMLALRKAMKLFNIKNAVSFHSSIEKAVRNKELQTHITDTYDFQPIDAYTVSGKQGTTKRNEIVKEFAESSKALITNARCLTEGVDVPNIDCIVFADPRKSKVDIVQALGRALRKKEGKDWGYVVLPVIYDGETNEIDNENFEEILSIVRGLASNDERIVEYFKDKEQNELKGSKESSQFQLEVVSDYMDEAELTKQLEIRLWEKLSRYEWMPFEEAREVAKALNLKSSTEWKSWAKSERPSNIPANPDNTYKDKGWIDWYDWLGYESIEFLPFDEAREVARSLNLRSSEEWRSWHKSGERGENIPYKPERKYKDLGWIDWYDWLGNENIEFLPFEEAREVARSLNLKSSREWKSECPRNISSVPNKTYKDKGWVDWYDWLGYEGFLPFEEAREVARSLNFRSNREWRSWMKSGKRPSNIPANPQRVYRDEGWIDLYDWLGYEEFLPFEEAREVARSLNLKSSNEWQSWAKSERPSNIPSHPREKYKDQGWVGWYDWLGYEAK
ncbi:DEAD/DEAH box helicase family protein [Salibacteraceae bacterium]|nr:DEAD/DEAH box helicase family protein [Salibacteraceae bacterium]